MSHTMTRPAIETLPGEFVELTGEAAPLVPGSTVHIATETGKVNFSKVVGLLSARPLRRPSRNRPCDDRGEDIPVDLDVIVRAKSQFSAEEWNRRDNLPEMG